MKINYFILIPLVLVLFHLTDGKKYSDKYSDSTTEKRVFSKLNRPFRMEKLNIVWTKAQPILPESKLQSLYTQLKIQDKEEIQYKQYNAENDKDGKLAAKLRNKLIEIMKNYDLLENAEENYKKKDSDNYKNRSLFKDKKLKNLWEKAQVAGLSADELSELKDEFHHYQDKVDLYYSLVESLDESSKNRQANAVNEDELDAFNEVHPENEIKDIHRDYVDRANALRDHQQNLRETYRKLEEKTTDAKLKRDFVEPKVQNLWKTALESNFTEKELAALKEELFHFESRLLKLSHMYAEHAVSNEKHKAKKNVNADERLQELERNIKKHARKVEKLQEELERQVNKHVEL